MKACIVTIGYRSYLVPTGTVSHLLEVANACVPVVWAADAYKYDPKGEGFIDSLSLSDIELDDGSRADEPTIEPMKHPLADDDVQF